MKRRFKTAFILIIIIFSAVTALGIFFMRTDILINPFDSGVLFEYPVFSVDDGVNVFIIDSSQRRIIKTSADGNVLLSIEGGSREAGSFYNAAELYPQTDGSFYIINLIPDSGGFFTEAEEILKYDASNDSFCLVFRRDYSDNERLSRLVQRGALSKISVADGYVRWFETDDEGIIEYSKPETSPQIITRRILLMKEAALNTAFASGTSADLYYTGKRGDIVKFKSGKLETLYSYGEDKKHLPWDIVVSGGNIYFSDLLNYGIYHFGKDEIINLLPRSLFADSAATGENYPFYRFSVGTTGRIFTCMENRVIGIDKGKIIYDRNSGTRSVFSMIITVLFQILLVISVLIMMFSAGYFYTRVMKRKISLIIKQLIFVPLIVCAIAVASYFVFRNMSERYENLLKGKIAFMVQQMSGKINPDDLDKVKSADDFMNSSYRSLRTAMHSALNDNRDQWNYGFYFVLHKVNSGNISSMMFLNDGITADHPFSYLNDPEGIYKRALKGGIEIEKSTDAWGTWFYGVGPVYDGSGKVKGLIEVGKDNLSYQIENRNLLKKMITYVAGISIIMIFLFGFLTYVILSSVRSLSRGAGKISEGHWDVEIMPKSNDEIADLTHAFNRMAKYVRNYISEITQLNKAYHGFVPMEFLKFLNKESIIDVKRGDQIQQEMTVVFTDIRSFTDISESMTPKENFDFLNSYLGLVGPLVRSNGGFIDKYIGDAIMALYPASPDDAVKAALEIQKTIYEYNLGRAKKNMMQISIGTGIHTGLLMLGILGEDERVDSTVISDNVNLASRIEGLTKKFGANIIISETTYEGMQVRGLYSFRYLGMIRVKGKKHPVGVYEVLDGCFADERERKVKSASILSKGIEEFKKGDFRLAGAYFRKGAEKYPADSAFKVYLEICRESVKNPRKDFDGSLVFTNK